MLEPMPLPRHGIGAAAVGNRVFIPGGSPVAGFSTTAQSDFFTLSEDILLPHFVVGGQYTTSIVMTNPDPTRTAEVEVSLTDVSGEPLFTNLNEIPPDGSMRSTIALTIPPLAARTVSAAEAPSSPLKVGSARIRSTTRISVYGQIRNLEAPLTVYPAMPARNVVFDVRRIQQTGVSTGMVMLNVSGTPVAVTIRFHARATGAEVLRVEQTLRAGEQLSRFVHELFPELQNADFAGTMTVQASAQLAVAAFAFERNAVVTVPVTPIE
jgi:hypothetical protein